MSQENLKEFFEKATEDKELQEKLKDLARREEEIYTDLVSIGSAAGFTFTAQEALIFRASTAGNGVLSDSELETIAAGSSCNQLGFAPCGSW